MGHGPADLHGPGRLLERCLCGFPNPRKVTRNQVAVNATQRAKIHHDKRLLVIKIHRLDFLIVNFHVQKDPKSPAYDLYLTFWKPEYVYGNLQRDFRRPHRQQKQNSEF